MVKQTHQKEIVALDIFEAVRLRPTMYLGQVAPMDDKLPIIRDGKLQQIDKIWSPGFMHLIIEILENALDEAKRMKGKMKNIWIEINLDNNKVSIRDEGGGFHKAGYKHPKTKKNVVRTAFEELHAGSNFMDSSTNILGTHGVGAAICNILSEYFEVNTVNKTHYVHYIWKDYKVVKEHIEKNNKNKLGTEVSFFPSREVFRNYKWDKELIETYLSFKQFLIDINPFFKNLKITANFIEDGKEIESKVTSNFLPQEFIKVDNKEWGTIMLWPSYENSCSVSFINGSQCTGIHQKIINDWVNDFFEYNLAHHFYNTLISLNVPSTLMRFADQNKTKYALARFEIEEILENIFKGKLLRHLKGSKVTQEIEQKIEDRLYAENIKKIKKAQRTSKRKISDKYSPASKYKENIYITEGLCLEENTKIFIMRNNKILFSKLKDVKKEDLVITHKNKLQKITHINKSIKHGVSIQTSIGNIICSEKHKWFVYDKEKNKFYFEETKKLNKDKHKLVKNYLAFLESFDEIEYIDIINEKIIIINDKKEEWEISKNNKICIFDINSNQFVMKNSNDLKKGDILSKFITLSGA